MTTKAKFYVGVSVRGDFVRTYEEDPTLGGDDLVYELLDSTRKPTKKTHSKYYVIVGPFPTEASAIVFRDVEGINSVSEAVRREEATRSRFAAR